MERKQDEERLSYFSQRKGANSGGESVYVQQIREKIEERQRLKLIDAELEKRKQETLERLEKLKDEAPDSSEGHHPR
jgi:hypothetical protein